MLLAVTDKQLAFVQLVLFFKEKKTSGVSLPLYNNWHRFFFTYSSTKILKRFYKSTSVVANYLAQKKEILFGVGTFRTA